MTKKSMNTTVLAAVACAAAILGAAPAFAWGGGAPDNYYDQPAQSAAGYYNYAPGALAHATVHPAPVRKHHNAR